MNCPRYLTFPMKNLVLSLFSIAILALVGNSASAQRGIGGHSLILDDGLGHAVTITVPVPTSTYTWTLPGSGPPANIPSGTTNNSILRWNAGTTSWQEDVNVLATSGGLLNVASAYQIG